MPALAFAVGVYLPLSASVPIFVGGLVRGAVDRIKTTVERVVQRQKQSMIHQMARRQRDLHYRDGLLISLISVWLIRRRSIASPVWTR